MWYLFFPALEQYGMGNWGKVSEMLGKTEKACMDHYLDLYMPTWGNCLPESTIVDGKMVPTKELLKDPVSTTTITITTSNSGGSCGCRGD